LEGKEMTKQHVKRKLDTFEKHQLKIAKSTLKMPDPILGVMGGMSKFQAKEIIKKLGGH
jgi:hypothetical protein